MGAIQISAASSMELAFSLRNTPLSPFRSSLKAFVFAKACSQGSTGCLEPIP